MSEAKITSQVVVDTTPELAFEAVTSAQELREWCCDQAWTELRPGGRFEVRWNSGYRAEGRFTALEAPRHAALTWKGSGEPGETVVEWTIRPVEGGVEVTVVHSGFGPGPEWKKAVAESEAGWGTGLENLKSTLETGVDLRWARRPFLGILFDDLNPERAAKEGIAAERGIYLNATVEGSGARAAGLGKGDVIVTIARMATPAFPELTTALSCCRAGDVVDVEVVRGQARETIQVTLGERPHQVTPGTAEELADLLAQQYQENDNLLQTTVAGVTEEEAAWHPAEGEWCAKQVLAHLSIVERDQQCILGVLALDGWLDTGPGNTSILAGRMETILALEPTLPGMVSRFLADGAETLGFVRRLPADTVAHKARFRRIAQNMLSLPEHTREHIGQIKAVVAAVRS